MTQIAIAADHAGFPLKEQLKEWMQNQGYQVHDHGCHSPDSVDYPLYAHALAEAILKGEAPLGVAICGSGNGISMTLNRHRGIRAALCWTPELATLARQHNDANVLSLPGRFVTFEEAIPILQAFLAGSFEGGRHARRVSQIDA